MSSKVWGIGETVTCISQGPMMAEQEKGYVAMYNERFHNPASATVRALQNSV